MNSFLNKESKFEIIKKKLKQSTLRNNYVMFYYLIGTTSLFLFCQVLKTSPLITKHKYNYDNCIKILKYELTENSLMKVCEILNHQENYQSFVYNLLYTWLIVYSLVREVIGNYHFNYKYWLISHLSAFGWAMIDEIQCAKFSLTSNSNYTNTQLTIISSTSILAFLLLFRQIYYKRVRFDILFRVIIIFLVLYLLLISISTNIVIHLHHALVSGFLTFFFINFSSSFERLIHGILIGIVVQGLNFFSLSETLMFYISDRGPPSLNHLLIIYSIFIILWFLISFIKTFCCIEKIDEDDASELLIPNNRDIEFYNLL